MAPFRIDLSDLNHGWVIADVSTDEQSYRMFVSYISDGLYYLAEATLTVVRSSFSDTVTFTGMDEPGQDRWILRRIDADRIAIKILSFQDSLSRLPDERGETAFEAECTPIRLLRQVKGQLHVLLNKYGEEGYLLRWRHPFPMRQFRQLEAMLQEMKR